MWNTSYEGRTYALPCSPRCLIWDKCRNRSKQFLNTLGYQQHVAHPSLSVFIGYAESSPFDSGLIVFWRVFFMFCDKIVPDFNSSGGSRE
jgi:hypothetical protein